MQINNLKDFESFYLELPEYQYTLSEYFLKKLSEDSQLFNYRYFIKKNKFGYGEDEFMILWDLIVKSMPPTFSFCEIGVHKGQILTLIRLLADRYQKRVMRYGVSPMNGDKTTFKGDFNLDVRVLHKNFRLETDYVILQGYSTEEPIIKKASVHSPFDILYIDGSHRKEDVESDFINYLPMISDNGLLVVDDSNNNMPCTYGPPFGAGGRYWGNQDVSDVTDRFMQNNNNFVYLGSIIHNRIWKRRRIAKFEITNNHHK